MAKPAKKKKQEVLSHQNCSLKMRSVQDALYVLSGKWKLPILISLSFGKKRFREIAKETTGITDRMLSKELRELELNQLLTRAVYDTFPPTVEYQITEHGKTLQPVIDELANWGLAHKKKIIHKQ